MTNYKNLEAWKKSMQLVKEIYILTKIFPKEELYGLTSQIKRAAVSIPSDAPVQRLPVRHGSLVFHAPRNPDRHKHGQLRPASLVPLRQSRS